jgi:hypothetical protein
MKVRFSFPLLCNLLDRLHPLVDRLQRLVDVLVSTNPPVDQNALPTPPPAYATATIRDLPPSFTPVLAHSSPSLGSRSSSLSRGSPSFPTNEATSHLPPLDEEQPDIEAHDLVKRLSELTIKTFQLGGKPPDPNSDSLVKEVRPFLSPYILFIADFPHLCRPNNCSNCSPRSTRMLARTS